MDQILLGEFRHSLDEKNRVSVPRKFREALDARNPEDGFYLTRGLDGAIWMFTESQWRDVDQIFRSLRGNGLGSEKVRQFERAFYKSAMKGVPDRQGRILLTDRLLQHASIQKEVVFIGMPHKIEIWAAEKQRAFDEEFEGGRYDDVAREFFG